MIKRLSQSGFHSFVALGSFLLLGGCGGAEFVRLAHSVNSSEPKGELVHIKKQEEWSFSGKEVTWKITKNLNECLRPINAWAAYNFLPSRAR